MRKVLGFIVILLFVGFSYSQTVREMRFENVKLEAVLKALAEVSGMNVIFDPAVSQDLQKTVSVAIYRPVPVGEAMNIILKEYSLIAVPADTKVFRITKGAEININVAGLDDKQINEIINFLKARVTPSAEIVIDKTLKTIYIRDEEKNIKRLEPILKDYRKLADALVPAEERTTRVFYLRGIGLDEAERRIKSYTRPDTSITKSYDFSALVITDSPKQMELYTEALKPFLITTPSERRPVTKIFYLKYISPDEFIKMIEPLRSEAGIVLSGGALVERQDLQPQQQTQAQQQTQKAPTPIIREFNAVMITDYPDVLQIIQERFKDYISESPVRVSIEARIVEVREESLRELGINWNALLSQANVPQFWSGGIGSNIGTNTPLNPIPGLSATPGGILTFTYQRGVLNALNLRISALERIDKAKSIAKPTVVTINGQKATIKQGVQVPYQTAAVGAGGTAVPNIQFKDVVLQLDVTPVISPDGRILMDIEIKRDTVGIQTPQGPAINTKEVKTKIVVENGQTVVLGGIIDNQDGVTNEGVPGVVRVPLLKYLFGQERVRKFDTELLIFITPTVISQ
ncbi:pilus assembly protein [Pampinifervens florentissimum]|uniref:pilus assembly protein n=1 Tax=Pampinifervens florentissimum TaxID=1632019 RepID=UPI0013B4A153|nr:pilus assembly protein [Hydrogenobacter sp. T-8]QID32493.1 pilus assembly protein [Hydrogenobacter sp. T-8]